MSHAQVIHNPLLVACVNDGPPAPSPTENHMIKVLENEGGLENAK